MRGARRALPHNVDIFMTKESRPEPARRTTTPLTPKERYSAKSLWNAPWSVRRIKDDLDVASVDAA